MLREARFSVAWVPPVGSGLGITWADTADCTWSELQWLAERIKEQREAEYRASKAK